MGNTSGSEFGAVMIRTDKQLFFAGDIVQGNIYLNVIKQGYHGKIVEFSVVGKEKTRWTTGSGKHRRVHIGKNKFYQQAVAIYQFNDDNLPIGQFVFPFQLQLPPQLQGSFNYIHGAIASTTYQVKAKIISTTSKITSIKNKQQIMIREPIKEQIQGKKEINRVDVKTWCCIQQGSSEVQCSIDKNHFLPNEFVTIQTEIDNTQCKLDMTKIQASLINQISLTSNSGNRKILNNQLNFSLVGSVTSGMKINPEQNLSNVQLQICNVTQPTIPLAPSSNGNFIKSNYFIKIETTFDGCTCCSATPQTWIPITILAIIPQNYFQPIEQPQNWNPQNFNETFIKYNENPFDQNQKMGLLNQQMN